MSHAATRENHFMVTVNSKLKSGSLVGIFEAGNEDSVAGT